MKLKDYEIKVDKYNWTLRTKTATKDKKGKKTGKFHFENTYYPNLSAMAIKIADSEARKIAARAGSEIEDISRKLGKALKTIEKEIREQCQKTVKTAK